MAQDIRHELQCWERELLAHHRWGDYPEQREIEHERLKALWRPIHPVCERTQRLIESITALELCNWRLLESIGELCACIGAKRLPEYVIGHHLSVDTRRWHKYWGYFFALRTWALGEHLCGVPSMQSVCDPQGCIEHHVFELLGERNELKALYVERLARAVFYWLTGHSEPDTAPGIAHAGCVAALEHRILALDPELRVVPREYLFADEGNLHACHHKLFRHLDIIISSIGAERWRGGMPARCTDGIERAEDLDAWLIPLAAWVQGRAPQGDEAASEQWQQVFAALGERDDQKVFLAALLESLLRSQQVAARERAEAESGSA